MATLEGDLQTRSEELAHAKEELRNLGVSLNAAQARVEELESQVFFLLLITVRPPAFFLLLASVKMGFWKHAVLGNAHRLSESRGCFFLPPAFFPPLLYPECATAPGYGQGAGDIF